MSNNPNMKHATLVATSLALLLVGCNSRVELPAIPDDFRGVWRGIYSEEDLMMQVGASTLVLAAEGDRDLCKAEKIVTFETGFLHRKKMLAVVCDGASTMQDQELERSINLEAPDDYRKTYYLSFSEGTREISVDHTKWMSKGWSDSEGVYRWKLGDFYRSSTGQ